MRSYESAPAGAVTRARILRRNSTEAERMLWRALRLQQSEFEWRRQMPIGRYVVDFACFSAKLIIELDGGHHAFQEDYDEERTRFLQGEGYRVMRFWNRDVVENLDGVFTAIATELSKSPSPLGGEGGPKDRMRGEPLSNNPSPQPSPTRGEGGSVNHSVGV